MTITKEEGGAQLTKGGGTSFKKHKNKEIKDESINQSKIEKSKNEWRQSKTNFSHPYEKNRALLTFDMVLLLIFVTTSITIRG